MSPAWVSHEVKRMVRTQGQRLTAFLRTKGRCAYCGCELDKNHYHVDHIIPIAKGGKTNKDNLVASCPDCNICKSNLSIEEFRQKINGFVTKTHHGRIIAKYYGVQPHQIRFFFEETDDGNIQDNFNEFLDRQ